MGHFQLVKRIKQNNFLCQKRRKCSKTKMDTSNGHRANKRGFRCQHLGQNIKENNEEIRLGLLGEAGWGNDWQGDKGKFWGEWLCSVS